MLTEKQIKKPYNKKPDFRTKAGKLFLAQQRGLTDAEASRQIGISPKNVLELERTKTYQAIQKKFADVMLDKITMAEIADAVVDNISKLIEPFLIIIMALAVAFLVSAIVIPI